MFALNEGLPTEDQMPWEDAVNIQHYSYKASVQPTASIPLEVKHEAIQKFRTLKRSSEEIELLKQEMMNCLVYYEQKIMSLRIFQEENLSQSSEEGLRPLGSNCLISKQIAISSNKLSDLRKQFEVIQPGKILHSQMLLYNALDFTVALCKNT